MDVISVLLLLFQGSFFCYSMFKVVICNRMKQKGRELCHNNRPLNSQVGANPKFTRTSPLNNEALRHVSQNSLEHSGPLTYRVVAF